MTLEWMALCMPVFLTHFAQAMTCSTKNAISTSRTNAVPRAQMQGTNSESCYRSRSRVLTIAYHSRSALWVHSLISCSERSRIRFAFTDLALSDH